MNLSKWNQEAISAQQSGKRFLFIYTISAIVLSIVLCIGCNTDTPNEEEVEQGTSDVHVAFAGGGWRAHTGHSAWVMSLLSANEDNCKLNANGGTPDCLKEAFENVKTVSGNSGGSWFSSMLMYDEDIVNAITNKNARKHWGDPYGSNPYQGWLGKQDSIFSVYSGPFGDCKSTGDTFVLCLFEEYFNSGSKDIPTPNWADMAENLVYKGYDWESYGNLGEGNQQPWASGKPLLMAGAMMMNSVLLNDDDDEEETFYQICLPPNKVDMDEDDGSWCVNSQNNHVATPDVLPVTFTGISKENAHLKSPSFIGLNGVPLNMGYGVASYFSSTSYTNTINSKGQSTDKVPVMRAATASSAALGYASSYKILHPFYKEACPKKHHIQLTAWDCTYHARDLALGFSVNSNNEVEYVDDSNLDKIKLSNLNSERVLRVADGGVVDNSGIAQLVSYIQLNNLDSTDAFNIIAFDDVQYDDDTISADKGKYPSTDISYLFEGTPKGGVCLKGACIDVPDLQIVQLNSASATPITKYSWAVVDSDNQTTTDSLHYYIYEVVTKSNEYFNIGSGKKGTLHVFASDFANCGDLPENDNKSFPCYKDMIQNFYPTLNKTPDHGSSTSNGLSMLKEAFGL